MSEWMPISTAPKDVMVLTYCPWVKRCDLADTIQSPEVYQRSAGAFSLARVMGNSHASLANHLIGCHCPPLPHLSRTERNERCHFRLGYCLLARRLCRSGLMERK